MQLAAVMVVLGISGVGGATLESGPLSFLSHCTPPAQLEEALTRQIGVRFWSTGIEVPGAGQLLDGAPVIRLVTGSPAGGSERLQDVGSLLGRLAGSELETTEP